MKSVSEQIDLIRRGTEQIEPADGLQKKLEKSLKTGKPLRVKYGIDPTGIDVHLGHTVPLRKLRQFQELGHQAVLIIGNYTALVGDPSGRDETRARLTERDVTANARDYLKQVSKVIDIERTEVYWNGGWFSQFEFLYVLEVLSRFTVQRILERDDFAKRLRAQTPIYLHECLYPLMQGYDSAVIKADVELGGSEQLFSLMVGRDMQRDDRICELALDARESLIKAFHKSPSQPVNEKALNYLQDSPDASDSKQEPQVCLTLPILRGLDGVRRMGKSLGNYIGVGMSADEQFAKTMSMPDEPMKEWFTLLTNQPAAEIEALTDPTRTHPMEAKKTLGREIVAYYHGVNAAAQAAKDWVKQHSQGHDPANMPEVQIAAADAADGSIGLLDLLVKLKFCASKNEARNRVSEGAVNVGPERTKVTDPKATINLKDGLVVRLGAKKIVRVSLASGR